MKKLLNEWKKYLNEKVPHLIISLKLPLHYSEVEVGTLIKFPKDELIDGIKGKFISMPEKYETIEFPGCYPKEKRIDVIELYDGTEQLILKEALKKYDELSKKETI